MGWLNAEQRRIVEAALARLLPAGADPSTEPGALEAGVVDYIDRTLDAFAHDPPHIFAGGPSSGRRGGSGDSTAAYGAFMPLTRLEELAWRTRIEGWQQAYSMGFVRLGEDFADVDAEDQDARLELEPAFRDLLYEHACEGMYAAPEYGGNRDLAGWRLAQWAGDVAPDGWTDAQVIDPVANP